jgi:hypothetical protein
MGTLNLPFKRAGNELLLLTIKPAQLGKRNYLVKCPANWWARLWGNHVIGEISGINIAGDTVDVTIDLTHPKRFDTNSTFSLDIVKGRLQVTQHKRA